MKCLARDDPKDDVVKVTNESIAANLKPIQYRYTLISQSLKDQEMVESSRKFLTSKENNFIVSKDNRIIDVIIDFYQLF